MNINFFSNRLSNEKKYWENLIKAKFPNSEILDEMPPLTEDERACLPERVSSFYDLGRCFVQFLYCVLQPYKNVYTLLLSNHLEDLYKYFKEHNEIEIKPPLSYEVYEFLKAVSVDTAIQICHLICDNKSDAEILNSYLVTEDVQPFIRYFSQLDLSKNTLGALVKVMNVFTFLEFNKLFLASDEGQDPAILNVLLRSNISKLPFNKLDMPESNITNYWINLFVESLSNLFELIDNKDNANFIEHIGNDLSCGVWLVFTKYSYCQVMITLSLIWDFITYDEKKIVQDVLDYTNEIAFSIKGIQIFPFQKDVNLVNRWVNVMQKRLLKFNSKMYATTIENIDINGKSQIQSNICAVKDINLPFPTRILANFDQRRYILTGIYQYYGGNFENMNCEDFIYLFGGQNKKPSTYNPPYYWCDSESVMKAILKVLYIRQPSKLNKLILHISDKESGVDSHNWGKNKNSVAYRDIESNIINIVKKESGIIIPKL